MKPLFITFLIINGYIKYYDESRYLTLIFNQEDKNSRRKYMKRCKIELKNLKIIISNQK